MDKMTTVYFCRHGEYVGQDKVVAFRASGHPLTDFGKNQIQKTARFLSDKKISALYASPILRCQQSAKIVGEVLKLKVNTDERLLEVDSPYANINLDKYLEMAKGTKEFYNLPLQIAKGETIEEVKERMKKFLKSILEKYENKNVTVFSHGDPIMILAYHLQGKNFSKLKRFKDRYIEVGQMMELDFNGKKLLKIIWF